MERVYLPASTAERQLSGRRNRNRVMVAGVFTAPEWTVIDTPHGRGPSLERNCIVLGALQPFNPGRSLAALNTTLSDLIHLPKGEDPTPGITPFEWTPTGLAPGVIRGFERIGFAVRKEETTFYFDETARGSKLIDATKASPVEVRVALYAQTDVLFYPDPRLAWLVAGNIDSHFRGQEENPTLADLMDIIPAGHFFDRLSTPYHQASMGELQEIFQTLAAGPRQPELNQTSIE